MKAVHFIHFPDEHGERYQNAVKVFGKPAFVHRYWDVRAWQEIAPGDVAVFAQGSADDPFNPYVYDDSSHF